MATAAASTSTPSSKPSKARNPDAVFVKVGFSNKLGAAKAHVRYIAFRSRDMPEQDRGVFDRDHDHAQVDKFIKSLDDPLTRHPQVAKVHKVILSFSQAQWDNCGYASWKPLAREVMQRFEERTGKRLEWVAAEHLKKGHPHCHVAIKSVWTDEQGKRHRLRFGKEDMKVLKEEMRRVYERDRQMSRPVEKALKKEAWAIKGPQLAKATRTIMDRLATAMRQEQARQEAERQMLVEQEARRQIQRQRERERGG